MSTACARCGNPAAEAPKGKGFLNKIQLLTTKTIMTRRLRIQMFTFEPWTENPQDQVRMIYSDVHLCNKCAVDVWDYAQTPIETKEKP